MADYIEEYIRSGFRKDFVDWVSLWVPYPSSNPEETPIRRRSISLGDVGYFDEAGEFEVLFNIYLSEDANLEKGYDPPANFKPYNPRISPSDQWRERTLKKKMDQTMTTGDLKSHKSREELKGGRPLLSLKTPTTLSSVTGTALIIPDGMVRTDFTVVALEQMQSYFDLSAQSWYDFYNKRRSSARPKFKNGSLLFVRVCYKTNTWAKASFKNCSQQVHLDLYKHDASIDVYTWAAQGEPVHAETGPPLEDLENGRARDYSQCIAVELSSLKIKKDNIKKFTVSVQSFFMSRTSLASKASTIKGRRS